MSRKNIRLCDGESCLARPYPSSQKGGTLIAEDVTTRAEHERRICNPDGYRPDHCARCLGRVLHVHDYLERKLFGEGVDEEGWAPLLRIIRYLCIACGASWRILPRFVARRLWRTWSVVEEQTLSAPPPSARPPVPERTVRRWWERLRSRARMVVEVLATSGNRALETLAEEVGLDGTRERLVGAYVAENAPPARRRLADLAALIHRLAPGVRLV